MIFNHCAVVADGHFHGLALRGKRLFSHISLVVKAGIIIITVILFTRILLGKIFRQLQFMLKSHYNSAEGLNDSFDYSYTTATASIRFAAGFCLTRFNPLSLPKS